MDYVNGKPIIFKLKIVVFIAFQKFFLKYQLYFFLSIQNMGIFCQVIIVVFTFNYYFEKGLSNETVATLEIVF